jgi:flagellar basal body-associated protein FliL
MQVACDVIIRPADKPQVPEPVVVPSEEPESKSANSAILVVAIVVPVVLVLVVAVILIGCLLKRNRKVPYEGIFFFFYFFLYLSSPYSKRKFNRKK